MPRRPRPPASAREIAAYLAGARLKGVWVAGSTGWASCYEPTNTEVVESLAAEDSEVFASMNPRDWWYFFWLGWEAPPQ